MLANQIVFSINKAQHNEYQRFPFLTKCVFEAQEKSPLIIFFFPTFDFPLFFIYLLEKPLGEI